FARKHLRWLHGRFTIPDVPRGSRRVRLRFAPRTGGVHPMQPPCNRDSDAQRGTVSPREFIRAWQESSSLAEVAQRVRGKKNACRVRAYRYRQEGGPLKAFPVVEVEPPDWDELAEFAASLLPDAEARRQAGWF